MHDPDFLANIKRQPPLGSHRPGVAPRPVVHHGAFLCGGHRIGPGGPAGAGGSFRVALPAAQEVLLAAPDGQALPQGSGNAAVSGTGRGVQPPDRREGPPDAETDR